VSAKKNIAFGCYLTAAAALGAWGFVYLLRGDFMPYHAVAAGMPWTAVPHSFQVLILTLYKLVGAAWIVVALSLLLMLFGPFRQGALWARRAIPALLLIQGAGVMNAMAYITLNTPAMPPWAFTIAVMGLAVVGFFLSSGDQGGQKSRPVP
jgi:hypothetical protein